MNTSAKYQTAWLALAVCTLLPLAQTSRAGQAGESCPAQPGQADWLEQQIGRRELALDAERERAIGLLQKFLKDNPKAPQRADALFRLAELQWERAEQQLLKRMRSYESELDAFRNGKRKQRPPEPTIDLASSIVVYEEILEQHTDFARTDTVLYLYGFGLNEQGDETAALSIFRLLIKRFPKSSFVPDAHLAIGEHRFAKGNYPQARKSYARVLQFVSSPLYDLALYKTAWCFFKEGKAKDAAENFKRVLARARSRKLEAKSTKLSTPSADLEREALEDLAFTFSEYGGAKEAYRFMKQVGGEEYSIKVLKRLGQVFFRQARYNQAIDSYKMLVDRFPLAQESPEHQARIAEACQGAGHLERSLVERRKLAESYGPGSSWFNKYKDNPTLVGRARELAEGALRFVAMYRHKQAQTSKKKSSYRRASRAYGDYLKAFPDTEQAAQVHFYMGEVLFKLSQFEKAASHYGTAANKLKKPEKRKDAAYAAVLAFDELRKTKPHPKEPLATAEPLSPGEKGFEEAVDAFASLAEKDEKLPQLRFEVGRLYYFRGQFSEASARLLALIERHPEQSFAEPAADLALDCFSRSGQWDKLEENSRRFLEEGWFNKKQLGQQLPEFIAGAIFQQAGALSKDKKHRSAAEQFERLVKEFPKDQLAPKSLFNAAVSMEKAGQKEKAIALYKKIIKRYPDKAADAQFVIAGIYARQYDYQAAAKNYAEFAERFAKDERAADSLLETALLHRALQEHEKEAQALKLFSKNYPDHPSSSRAKMFRAQALSKAGEHRAAEKVLRAYLGKEAARQNQERQTQLQLGLALLSQGKLRPARKQLERCGNFGKRKTPQGKELAAAAHCRFKLGELVFAEYQKIKLRPPMRRLAKLLKSKAGKLKQAEALFTKVVEAGHMEWGSAALFRIGDMYAQFAQAIYKAPLPKNLSEQELDVYRQELQSLAYPIEDKALTAFTISYQMARKHGYPSTWSQKTIKMLRKLDPAQFPKEEELRPSTSWADSFTTFGLELKSLPVPKKKRRTEKPGQTAAGGQS